MFELIAEQRYLRREEFRVQYHTLSMRERGGLSEAEYADHKMRDRDIRDTILLSVALVCFGLLASLSTYF